MPTERNFLKSEFASFDFSGTDQQQGIPPPPIQKPFRPDQQRIFLPPIQKLQDLGAMPLGAAIRGRKSRRKFSSSPLPLQSLSFLLWASQGIHKRINSSTALRTVPSAGARHALETYLAIMNVETLSPGIYRYLPLEHHLLLEFPHDKLPEELAHACQGQKFVGTGAVTFVWTAIPYRMEWRYGSLSHKVIAIDAGHVCQNLYLACESIGAGTCAVAAYDQKRIDRLLQVDGKDEFVIYIAPVGLRME